MHGGEPAAEETWRREVYLGCFAPSPTDSLHFGYLVAALGSYLDAWAAGGPADESAVRIDLARGARCCLPPGNWLVPCTLCTEGGTVLVRDRVRVQGALGRCARTWRARWATLCCGSIVYLLVYQLAVVMDDGFQGINLNCPRGWSVGLYTAL